MCIPSVRMCFLFWWNQFYSIGSIYYYYYKFRKPYAIFPVFALWWQHRSWIQNGHSSKIEFVLCLAIFTILYICITCIPFIHSFACCLRFGREWKKKNIIEKCSSLRPIHSTLPNMSRDESSDYLFFSEQKCELWVHKSECSIKTVKEKLFWSFPL